MTTVRISEDVDGPAANVWAILSDFGARARQAVNPK